MVNALSLSQAVHRDRHRHLRRHAVHPDADAVVLAGHLQCDQRWHADRRPDRAEQLPDCDHREPDR
ncbi:MAG: hypothetical protein MZW92_44420 [Comamonadaceae bacterium]|nr:hypothetical protein [Comamonadaceae bacterium]